MTRRARRSPRRRLLRRRSNARAPPLKSERCSGRKPPSSPRGASAPPRLALNAASAADVPQSADAASERVRVILHSSPGGAAGVGGGAPPKSAAETVTRADSYGVAGARPATDTASANQNSMASWVRSEPCPDESQHALMSHRRAAVALKPPSSRIINGALAAAAESCLPSCALNAHERLPWLPTTSSQPCRLTPFAARDLMQAFVVDVAPHARRRHARRDASRGNLR